jgi:hypothetical protein
MSKATYAGCGFDIIPIKLFPEIKLFIYLDIMPCGNRGYVNTYEEFMFNIIKSFKSIGFRVVGEDKQINRIIFKNGERNVIYYYSTWVEDVINNNIRKEIEDSDYVILIGYAPPKEFIDIFNNISLITSNTTYVSDTENTYHSDKGKFLLDRDVNLEILKSKIKDVYYIEFNQNISINYIKPAINLLTS